MAHTFEVLGITIHTRLTSRSFSVSGPGLQRNQIAARQLIRICRGRWVPRTNTMSISNRRLRLALDELANQEAELISGTPNIRTYEPVPPPSRAVDKSVSDEAQACVVCLTNQKVMTDRCGHLCLCIGCSTRVTKCPICRGPWSNPIRVWL